MNPGPSTDELISDLGRSINSRLDVISSEIATISDKMRDFTDQLNREKEEIAVVKDRTVQLEERLKEVSKKNELLEIGQRQDNIILYGVPERAEGEDRNQCLHTVIQLFNQCCSEKQWTEKDFSDIFHLGKKERMERPRPLLVKMVRGRDKRLVISSKTFRQALKKEGVTINDDLTPKQRDELRQLRGEGNMAFYRGQRLYCRPRESRNNQQTKSFLEEGRHSPNSNQHLHHANPYHQQYHVSRPPMSPAFPNEQHQRVSYSSGSGAMGSGGEGVGGTSGCGGDGGGSSGVEDNNNTVALTQRRHEDINLSPTSGPSEGQGGSGDVGDTGGADGDGAERGEGGDQQGTSDAEKADHQTPLPGRDGGVKTRLRSQRAGAEGRGKTGGSTQGRIDDMFQQSQQD